jgi:lipopolysaccharide transport system permease protein
VWAVLPPLAVTLTFVFINRHGILELEGEAMAFPYPVFVFTGTMLWQVFVDAINAPLKLLTTYRGLLVKINFPREALILAGIEEVLFNLGIRLVLAAAVLLYFRVPLPPSALLVPLGIVGLLGLGLLIGIVLAPVGVLYTDVQYSLTILISMWFFLTPVVYAPRAGETAELLNLINPVTPLLVTSREWLLAGSATDLRSFIVVLAVTLTLLVFGWLFFRIAMPHMVERMGA